MMDAQQIFFNIDVPFECNDSCPYLRVTRDVYGTGDSPTEVDCTATRWQDCPVVDDKIREMEEGEDE